MVNDVLLFKVMMLLEEKKVRLTNKGFPLLRTGLVFWSRIELLCIYKSFVLSFLLLFVLSKNNQEIGAK